MANQRNLFFCLSHIKLIDIYFHAKLCHLFVIHSLRMVINFKTIIYLSIYLSIYIYISIHPPIQSMHLKVDCRCNELYLQVFQHTSPKNKDRHPYNTALLLHCIKHINLIMSCHI